MLDALGDTEAGASVLSDMCAAPDLDPCGLVENLALIERPVWLVIDGLHELRSVDALRQLELFLLRAPDRLRVVLSSRHELRLGLHRLRLEGALTEIGADDLRFSEDEARELLASAGVVLSESALGALLERAEGWAAGLRLAALGEDVADPQCKERSTVLRLAGTINYKTGAYADHRGQPGPLAIRPRPASGRPPRPAFTPRAFTGRSTKGRGERGPIQADPRRRVLPPAGRDQGASARGTCALPGSRRRASVVFGLLTGTGMEMPRLRSGRHDL